MNENPMANEAQTRMMYEVALYREQLGMLQKEMERVSLTAVDLNNALKTVENIDAKDVMVPVGGGTFMKASVKDVKLVVPIGAQYLREMGRDEALAELARRREATKKAIERLEVEFKKIAGKFQQVSGQLKDLEARAKISQRVDENIGEDYI
ncbi:MAG: prefoldin subunit alpha [Candidatus Micrarchaeota archaeon]